MKKVLMFMTFVLVLLGMASCSDDKDSKDDAYYVKYKWTYSSAYGGIIVVGKAVYVDANGDVQTVEGVRGGWEVTIGPVKKGFEASLSIEAPSGTYTPETTIEVCKGSEPFALQARGVFGVSYKINY